jgi:hypothetical protein
MLGKIQGSPSIHASVPEPDAGAEKKTALVSSEQIPAAETLSMATEAKGLMDIRAGLLRDSLQAALGATNQEQDKAPDIKGGVKTVESFFRSLGGLKTESE